MLPHAYQCSARVHRLTHGAIHLKALSRHVPLYFEEQRFMSRELPNDPCKDILGQSFKAR